MTNFEYLLDKFDPTYGGLTVAELHALATIMKEKLNQSKAVKEAVDLCQPKFKEASEYETAYATLDAKLKKAIEIITWYGRAAQVSEYHNDNGHKARHFLSEIATAISAGAKDE